MGAKLQNAGLVNRVAQLNLPAPFPPEKPGVPAALMLGSELEARGDRLVQPHFGARNVLVECGKART